MRKPQKIWDLVNSHLLQSLERHLIGTSTASATSKVATNQGIQSWQQKIWAEGAARRNFCLGRELADAGAKKGRTPPPVLPKMARTTTGSKQGQASQTRSWIFQRPILLIAATFCGGLGTAAAISAVFGVRFPTALPRQQASEDEEEEDEHHYVNWSNTHEAHPKYLFEPQTEDDLQLIVARAHKRGSKIRCVGSALSPNGIAFSEEAMLSLSLLDKVISIDPESKQVTVQSGARVQDVVEALRPHKLTLQNYASIREQSIGGFTQVSAHGTGAAIPPVDEQVTRMRLITPAMGAIELSATQNASLFRLAKVSLGLLGVVSELTLQCVDAHELLEETKVTTVEDVRRNHNKWLAENRHLKYLWLPYTDSVVVVKNNPVPEGSKKPKSKRDQVSEAKKTEPFRHLLAQRQGKAALEGVEGLGGPQLRDYLLSLDPLNTDWVKSVNKAEAEFWRRNEGYRFGPSDQLLGFDCGGQQWVLESCFPTGSLEKPSGADLRFMEELMQALEDANVPAPGPIEQRWSSSSSADMSPAACPGDLSQVHSWVGIIMYLPEDDMQLRASITQSFNAYASLVENKMLEEYKGAPHWAKLEVERMGLENARRMVAAKYPVEKFNQLRKELDPKNVLSNPMMDAVFPREAQSAWRLGSKAS